MLTKMSLQGCWVSGGANATCLYNDTERDTKTVLVPSIVAVIILIIFGLFLFVKLANYRIEKNRKKRRKEWKKFAGNDYEGVPS